MTTAELHKLNTRASVLTTRYQELMVMEQTPTIQDIIAEYMAEVDRIHAQTTVKREFLYNFKSGGWNSEYALTKEQAIAQAKERFNTNDGLDIDEKSFRVSTPADYQNCLSLFY